MSGSRALLRSTGTLAARGLVLLLMLLPSCNSGNGGNSGRPPRTVLLITVDTLRADHLHSYGFAQPVTPQMDALAERGVRFERAIAAASSTIPSHASMMTSRFARQHSAGARNGDTRLEGLPTLADHFTAAGFATAGFVSNAVLQRRSGLDAGFGHYDERLPALEQERAVPERVADDTVAAALDWLTAQGDDRVFLWVHVQDPHGPYTPPPEWIERIEPFSPGRDRTLEVQRGDTVRNGIPKYQALEGVSTISDYRRRYAAEVAYADHAIGRLAEAALARGDAVVLLTSDHGESLGEGGYFFQHAHATTPDLAIVPFLLVAPSLEPSQRADLVHHVDVAPTLLELAGLDPLAGARGLALGPYLRSREPLPERTVFCDTRGEAAAYALDGYLRLRADSFPSAAEATDEHGLGEAPLQLSGLVEGPGGAWAQGIDPELQRTLLDYVRAAVPVVPAALTDETLERLRTLGYLGDEE